MMFDMTRSRHLGADVNHRGNDERVDDGTKALRVVDTILQAQDDRIVSQSRGKGGPGSLRVGRLHAEQDELGCLERRHIRGRSRAQMLLLRLHLEKEAVRIDRVDVRFSADERDVVPGPDEQSSEVTSDGSGADDRDFHLLSILQQERSAAKRGSRAASLKYALPPLHGPGKSSRPDARDAPVLKP
jgi:hypothetical protein